tara:strand:- start:297 stop:1358 length:1062 start_codon:yes stop_codon:yes gene_type:complete
MAVTNGWGQAAKNNTNGWGKLATNNIGAGSIYEDSYSGDTALIGTSAAFSYSASSFTQADSNPTPTITGTTGGTFSSDAGVVFVSTSTGEINLSASTIASHTIFYLVDGVQASQTIDITASPFSNVYSFEFDGVDEFFTTGLSLAYTAVPNLTLSCWIKVDKTLLNNFSDFYPIGVRANASANGSPIRIIKQGATSVLRVCIQGQGGTTFSTSELGDNQWHHVLQTIQYDAGGTICNVYVDGTKEITDKLLNTYGPLTDNLFLGKRGTFGKFWRGQVDEVSVFNSVLSQTDINTIYGTGSPTNIASLNPLAWYRMGEEAAFSGGNWTLTDKGSGGNNATSNNMEEADRKADTP